MVLNFSTYLFDNYFIDKQSKLANQPASFWLRQADEHSHVEDKDR